MNVLLNVAVQADLISERAKIESLSQTISSLEQTVEALSHDSEILSQRLEQANADNKHLKESIEVVFIQGFILVLLLTSCRLLI